MPNKNIITAAAGILAATGIVVTVASLANASTSTSPTALTGYSLEYGQQSGEGRGQGGPGGGTHTAVTGAELTKSPPRSRPRTPASPSPPSRRTRTVRMT